MAMPAATINRQRRWSHANVPYLCSLMIRARSINSGAKGVRTKCGQSEDAKASRKFSGNASY
jgi:hypothetical protein